jgi:hypothetical protein
MVMVTDFQMPNVRKKERLWNRSLRGHKLPRWRPKPGTASSLRTRSVATFRLALLSRKSPNLPHWAVLVLVPIWVAVVGLGILTILIAPFAAGLQVSSTVSFTWLAAHQAAFLTPDGAITFLPLGLALLPVLLWRRAARWMTMQCPQSPAVLRSTLVIVTIAYAAFAAALAGITQVAEVRVSIALAIIGATVVAGIGCWWGLRRSNPGQMRLPNGFAGAAAATSWFGLVGAVLLGIAVVANFGEIAVARESVASQGADVAAVLLLELAYLPNLILWAAAYATGAGITLGASQIVSPYSTSDVLLPDLPILAAVPTSSPSWTAALPLVIMLGGWLAAVTAQRRAAVNGLGRRFIRVGMLAGMTFLLWFVGRLLVGGSLGDGRLDWVGPASGTASIAAVLVATGATVWALLPTLASEARPMAVDLTNRVKERRTKQSV